MPKFYAICSGPGLNYEGGVFATMAQLTAYKKGKQRPSGKVPWYTCFTNRAEAYRFAGILDPDDDDITFVSENRPPADGATGQVVVPYIMDLRFLKSKRPQTKMPIIDASINRRTNQTTGSQANNQMNPCPICLGKYLL